MATTFGTAGSGNYSAQPAQRPAAMKELVKLEPKPAFWYIHHPARWVFRGTEWLPWLSTLVADPGVSNVDQHGSTEAAEVAKRRRGWTLIPWDAIEGGYCISYEGVAGPVHMSRWETPKLVAGQTRIANDEEGYWAFCRSLVGRYIELPDPDFIAIQIERQEKKVEEWREKAPSSPFHRDALAVEEALLERMRSAMDALYNPPAEAGEPEAPKVAPKRARARS